jgi:hypothetical protein
MEIKERIIELNFYLLKAFDDKQEDKVDEIRNEINDLINLYLKTTIGSTGEFPSEPSEK